MVTFIIIGDSALPIDTNEEKRAARLMMDDCNLKHAFVWQAPHSTTFEASQHGFRGIQKIIVLFSREE